ncbi:hypothetical protein I6E29_00985 [Arcanobacterium haemolyticum]|nr:hypothetical protein [Arcanobacterium haemolyticum]
MSEESAGREMQYHSDCDCKIIPSWGKQVLGSYNPDLLHKQYEKMKELARNEFGGDVLKAYRSIPGLTRDGLIPDSEKLAPGRPHTHFDSSRPFRSYRGTKNIRDAVEGTNPLFSEGIEYQTNCQRCVVAYEMRRRNFAVTARPRPLNVNGLPYSDYDTTEWASAFKSVVIPCGSGSGEEEILQYLTQWGIGSRAIVQVSWNRSEAHVFIAENLADGVHFFDPQSGRMNVRRYFDLAVRGATSIMRVDNVEITDHVYKMCEEVQRGH